MADSSFHASFVLKLQDDLSGGLRRIIAETKRLRELAQSLGFKPLEGASAIVNRVDRDVLQLNRDLGATARQAETAAGAIRRMSAAELGRARDQAAQIRRAGDATRQLAGGASLEQVYGAGAWANVPRFNATGPMSSAGWRGRAGNAWANTRQRFGEFHERIGLAEGALAGVSLMEPIREAAEFDNVLTHIAITAGATEGTVRAKVAAMAETYRQMALQTKQSSHDVAESAQFLITTGIGEQMTNALLPIIAKAATAYNTPMRDAVQGAFSMHEELKIAPEDMGAALSSTALAAKQGHFSFADFSSFLPAIAAQAGVSGIRGLGGLDVLLAALETSRRGAGTSGQAATNLQDFLSYINAPIGTKSFAKGGIDLSALKLAAEKAGQNPIEAVIEAVRRRTDGMSDAQRGTYLGAVFHNQEARIFAQTMLQELQYYEEVKKKVSDAGDQTIEEDFKKAQNLHTRLVALTETSRQLTQRVGTGFSWVVPVGTALLGGVVVGMDWLDKHIPGVTTSVLALTGGMLGLIAVMGVLGTVAGPIKAGAQLLRIGSITRSVFSVSALRLLLNPYTALLAGVGLAAYEIWSHWERYEQNFHWMWAGLQQAAQGFGEWLAGVFTGDNARAARGAQDVWAGFHRFMESVWGSGGIVARLLQGFSDWVDSTWAAGLVTGFGKVITQSIEGWVKFVHDLQSMFDSLHMPTMAPIPDHPFMVPQGGPDSFPKYVPGAKPSTRDQDHEGGGLAPRNSRWEGGPMGPKLLHITFEANVAGVATMRDTDVPGARSGSQSRGPMLSRV